MIFEVGWRQKIGRGEHEYETLQHQVDSMQFRE
jgi:hypothetical protein